MYVGYRLNEQMEFLQIWVDISKRDKLKLIDFDDFDPFYMVIGALSNVYLGCISEPVVLVVFNHKNLYKYM